MNHSIRTLEEIAGLGLLKGIGQSFHINDKEKIENLHSQSFLLHGSMEFYYGSQCITANGKLISIPGIDNLAADPTKQQDLFREGMEKDTLNITDYGIMKNDLPVLIDTFVASNIYHFMVDVIGKLGIASKFLDLSKCKLMLNAWQPFQREALAAANIKYIWTGYEKRYVGNFYVPSLAGASRRCPRETILFARNLFHNVKTLDDANSVIYISRAKSSRKIINEDYLIGKLNTVTKVQCLTLEDYTFTEKISIFKAAKIIIGSYGAGLVFSMFTEENSQLIDILGPNFQGEHYSSLAHQSGLRYFSIGNIESKVLNNTTPNWNLDYALSEEQVEKVCEQLSACMADM